MTVPASSDDDLLGRVYSMSEDDDPEIERLRQVRAAFRELPSEDPPERGFAELMAAARVKADEMRVVTPGKGPGDRVAVAWWRRVAALLRRPPVLALASVMVLIGGAVLIGRRGDDEIARPSASNEPALEQKADQGGATAMMAGSAAAPADANGAAPTGETTVTATPTPEPDKPAEPTRPRVVHHAEGHAAPPAPPPPPPPLDEKPQDPALDFAKKEKQLDAKETTGLKQPTGKGATSAQDVPKDELLEGKDGTADAKSPTVVQGAADGRRFDDRNAPRKASVEQMLRQCQQAAGRGDCAAVKVIAGRIAKDDPGFYRANVQKDAAISRCLAK